MVERDKVIQIVQSARDKGGRPNLSKLNLSQTNLSMLDLSEAILTGPLDNLVGAILCGADLSKADLSNTALQENPLAGIYRAGTKLIPLPDPIKAKYDSKTRFPAGFSRFDEMEKTD